MKLTAVIAMLALGACSCFTIPANEVGYVHTFNEDNDDVRIVDTPDTPEKPDRPDGPKGKPKGDASDSNKKGGKKHDRPHNGKGKVK